MSNIFQIIHAFAISVLFISVGFADTTSNVIVAHFQPVKTNYFLGEPTTVYLVISNQSANELNIDDSSLLRASFNCSDSGITSEVLNVNHTIYFGPSQIMQILPKKVFLKTYYINKSLKFEKPGKYCVDCRVDVGDCLSTSFKIPPQDRAMMTQNYLTTKRKEPKKGDPDFYCFPAPTSSPPNAISVKVHDRIAFTLTKGSPEQLCKIYADLLERAKTLGVKDTKAQYNEPALALSSVRNPLVVPYLVKAITIADPKDPISEQSIIRALEEIGTPGAIRGMTDMDLTNRRTMFIRQYAAEALGRMKSKEGIPFLIKLLNDDLDYVQITAIKALGQIGTAECLDAIRKKMPDLKGKVKDTAIEVLKKSSAAK